MTYKKPPNLRYVDMCIYIDEHIYQESYDEERIYKYIYFIYYMLASKKKLFSYAEDYDNYALYCATAVFMRLINPRQFLPDEDPKKLPKIKSVLNYAKNTLLPLRVNYQNENFFHVVSPNMLDPEEANEVHKQFFLKVNKEYSAEKEALITEYFSQIGKTIKVFLQKYPYSSDPILFKNIYISCLLSFLNIITPSNKNKAKIEHLSAVNRLDEEALHQIYKEESQCKPILYHLDLSMGTFIQVVLNELKKFISKDIRQIISSDEPAEDLVKTLLVNSTGSDAND